MIKPKKITKKWRKEQAQEIIDRNVMDIHFSQGDVIEFAEVLQQDIEGAVRRINPQFPNDPRHVHTLIDNKWEARSWNKMITELTPIQSVKRVMRFAISGDLSDFRCSVDPQECENCGATDDLTVDHMLISFDRIANNFISDNGMPEISSPPDPNMVVNIFTDINVEADFIAYHAARACYQLLCRSCNASKGTGDEVLIR